MAKQDLLRGSVSHTGDGQATCWPRQHSRTASMEAPEGLKARLRHEKGVWEAKIQDRLKEELSRNYYKYEREIAGSFVANGQRLRPKSSKWRNRTTS
jgi:hypothetical protein